MSSSEAFSLIIMRNNNVLVSTSAKKIFCRWDGMIRELFFQIGEVKKSNGGALVMASLAL